jgi:hypothetical protein
MDSTSLFMLNTIACVRIRSVAKMRTGKEEKRIPRE